MKKITAYVFAIGGVILLAVCLALVKMMEGTGQTAAYLGIGAGCGIFGHGVGELITKRTMKNHPEEAKHLEIEKNDERNIAVGNYAKAKAYDLMIPLFGALFFSFALLNVDVPVILLLIAAYLFICGSSIYYRIKFEREM